MQDLIDAELTTAIGAAPHERTDSRVTQRNGARARLLSTPAGDIELRIPKLRVGSFFPSLLEPRRRVDRALWAVIMTAYVTGTSTRKVDDLVRALGCESRVSRSTVSRICAGIDEEVEAFRARRLDHIAMPYVYLDATYIKARHNHRIVSRAVVVATAVTTDGNREVLGVDVGDSEDEVFWTAFLRGLKDRGLGGVRLVISDAHAGLKASIARVFNGASWQRCKVHCMRNILGTVFEGSRSWENWERHPAGDEVVICLSGRMTVIRELDGEPEPVELGPCEAMINPLVCGTRRTSTNRPVSSRSRRAGGPSTGHADRPANGHWLLGCPSGAYVPEPASPSTVAGGRAWALAASASSWGSSTPASS